MMSLIFSYFLSDTPDSYRGVACPLCDFISSYFYSLTFSKVSFYFGKGEILNKKIFPLRGIIPQGELFPCVGRPSLAATILFFSLFSSKP